MNIYEKLLNIQTTLNAPKGQYNNFGKYKYRSCEDILEAVKPLLKANKVILTISDDIVAIGERFYVKAIATLVDVENCETINNVAFAREEDNKKGMDGSQVTGATSSYARKYALNGLFAIDDNKDPDTNEYNKIKKEELNKDLLNELKEYNIELTALATYYKKEVEYLTNDDLKKALEMKKKHGGNK